jgi:serine/threonine protein kinase
MEEHQDLGEHVPPIPFHPCSIQTAVRENTDILVDGRAVQATIIYQSGSTSQAFWLGRKLKQCIYGAIRECVVLDRVQHPTPWHATSRRAAVKILSWERIRNMQHAENPLNEIAAMQHIVNQHVIQCWSTLENDDYLFVFMPFLESGDLFQHVNDRGHLSEDESRYWFRQLLDVSKLTVRKASLSSTRPLTFHSTAGHRLLTRSRCLP